MLKFVIMVVVMFHIVAVIYGMTRHWDEANGVEKAVIIIWIVLAMHLIHWMFGFLPRPWV